MTTQTEPATGEDLPRRERLARAAAGQDPAEPRPAPPPRRPATRRKPTRPPLAARGPILVVALLLLGIGELMLYQAPLWIFVVTNVVLTLVALVIWRGRVQRRRRTGPRRPSSTRSTTFGGRGRRIPGAGAVRKAAGWLGFGGGTGRRGRTPSASGRTRPGPAGGGSRSSRSGGLAGRLFGGRSRRSGSGGSGSRSASGPAGGLRSRIAARRNRASQNGSAASRGRGGSRTGRLLGAFRQGVREGASNPPSPRSRPNSTTPRRPAPARPTATQPKETKDGGEKVGIFRGRGSGGPRPAGGQHYGGPGKYADASGERSLFAYGRSLDRAPDLFEEVARELDRWAREGEEDQPVDTSIPDAIRAAAQVVRSLGADSSEWGVNYRRRHETDEDRLNNPARGSRSVESKRDVRAAHHEGL